VSNSTRSTSYDERYVVPLEASRRGAHRARVNPVMAALPIIAVTGIVVGAIALVYVVLGSLSDGGTDSAAPTSTPAGTPAAGASVTPSGSAAASEPSEEVTPTSTAVAGTVDKTIQLTVYNGSGTSGLGLRGAEKLRAAGWTVGEPATWTGAPVKTTTVFYATAAQRASAASVAKTLGRGAPKLSAAKAGVGITIVIGPDFPGASATRTRSGSSPAGTEGAATRTPTGGTTPTPRTTTPAASASATAPTGTPAG